MGLSSLLDRFAGSSGASSGPAGRADPGHRHQPCRQGAGDPDYLPLAPLIEEHVVPFAYSSRTLVEKTLLVRHAARVSALMDEHCRTCAEQIDAGSFDILFANSCQFLRTTAIGRFATIPSVLYLQEPYRWLYEAMPDLVWAAPAAAPLRSTAALRARVLDARAIRNARLQVREEIANAKAFDRILCNSYFSRESILRAYGIAADVCYLGIDTDHFHPRDVPREPFVLGLGAFTREKNMRLCIEAVALLPAPRPALRWIGNVADGGYLAEMTALAAARGVVLEPRSRVTEDELLDTLCRATAMIYAPRLEPFGLAPLEAGACGTPVIAVAEGGVRETILHGVNGLLVDGHAAALAEALGSLIREPGLADRLGRQGRALAEEKWGIAAAGDRLIARLREFATSVVDAGRAPALNPAAAR